jgi:pimeloyl-ACP methyl ester carboxylesterase
VRGGVTIRRAYLDAPHGQLHLRRTGEGGEPLLLLHQSPLSGAMFEAALPLLARAGFDAAALDTPGYGGSDPPPSEATIAAYADAAHMAIQALGWDRAHILGHHTGASIAASLAARYPQAVLKLVLNGVALLSDEERAFFAGFRFAPIAPRPDGGHLTDAWNQRLAATPGWSDIDAMHRYVVEMLANPARYHLGFVAAFAHDLESDLRRIAAPTLVLTNTGEDLYEASRRAAALRPDWAFAALEGGTHDIVDEQPEAWVAAVTRFLSD